MTPYDYIINIMLATLNAIISTRPTRSLKTKQDSNAHSVFP